MPDRDIMLVTLSSLHPTEWPSESTTVNTPSQQPSQKPTLPAEPMMVETPKPDVSEPAGMSTLWELWPDLDTAVLQWVYSRHGETGIEQAVNEILAMGSNPDISQPTSSGPEMVKIDPWFIIEDTRKPKQRVKSMWKQSMAQKQTNLDEEKKKLNAKILKLAEMMEYDDDY